MLWKIRLQPLPQRDRMALFRIPKPEVVALDSWPREVSVLDCLPERPRWRRRQRTGAGLPTRRERSCGSSVYYDAPGQEGHRPLLSFRISDA